MNNNKSIIDTYTTMYPVDIVVCNKYTTIKDIAKKYKYTNGEEITYDCSTSDAITIKAKSKKDNSNCIIIYHIQDFGSTSKERNEERLKTIVHECIHAALFTYELIDSDVSLDSQEPFAYYIEYIFGCVLKTLNKKQ